MSYRFEDFELDMSKHELRKDGAVVHVEPLVFDLIAHLAANGGRTISKDELIEAVWGGRIVSDATVAGCLKSARKALGDSGEEQRLVRTVRGRGVQFAAQVVRTGVSSPVESTVAGGAIPVEKPAAGKPPSLAVLPFRVIGSSESHPAIAEALAHDIIQALSRLRWLRVIARGSAFQFRSGDASPEQVRDQLGIRYCITGTIEISGQNISVNVELVDLERDTIIWVDRFDGEIGDIHEIRASIVSQTVASIETRITQHEAGLAQLAGTENLDSWSAFHLGLSHMYRFTETGTKQAIILFNRSIELDPAFARAHAALSFAQFQNAFNEYEGVDKIAATQTAFAAAERSMELDSLDPFSNFVHGRAHWLTGEVEQSLGWLERATEINPNFAQGHYARGLAALMAEAPVDTHAAASRAAFLSPLDPLLYGFQGLRALTFLAEGKHDEAAEWMNRAAAAPGALVVMDLGAVVTNALAGNAALAAKWAERARTRNPEVDASYFFKALPFQSPQMRDKITAVLKAHGF